jgi:hypothetical protein
MACYLLMVPAKCFYRIIKSLRATSAKSQLYLFSSVAAKLFI